MVVCRELTGSGIKSAYAIIALVGIVALVGLCIVLVV